MSYARLHSAGHLLDEGFGLLVGIIRGSILQFALGFVPELILASLWLAGEFPELMGAGSDLFFALMGAWVTHCLMTKNVAARASRRVATLTTVPLRIPSPLV